MEDTASHAVDLVSQLPLEILCQVFNELPKYHLRRWISVTYVCRRWRMAALAFPSLWGQIDCNAGASWMEEMMVRSKDAPISLRMECPDQNLGLINPAKLAAFNKIWKTQTSRLREVMLHGTEVTIKSSIVLGVKSAAPLLETLKIAVILAEDGPDFIAVALPGELFEGGTPKLRELSLSLCYFPWTSSIFTGLTVFHMEMPNEYYHPQGHFLLDALTRMPALTSLHLRGSFPLVRQEALAPGYVLPLLHLKELVISNDYVRCTLFFQHIQIPTSTLVELHCSDIVGAGLYSRTDVRGLGVALSSAWLTAPLSAPPHSPRRLYPSGLSLSSLDQMRSFESHFELQHLPTQLEDQAIQEGNELPPPVSFRIAFIIPYNNIDPLNSLRLSLSRLTRLELHIPDLTEEQWVAAATSLRLVQEITLNDECSSSFLILLKDDPRFDPDPSFASQDVYFPNLRKMAFRGVDFSDIPIDIFATWSDGLGPKVEFLLMMLNFRFQIAGITLEVLDIRDCTGMMKQEMDSLIQDGLVREGCWDDGCWVERSPPWL